MNNRAPSLYHSLMLLAEQKVASDDAVADTPRACLHPVEAEVVDLFVQLSRLLGQPRSLGEIYGLLFISAEPLAMDDFIERLHLSKGSASQGLKYLRNLGAVRPVNVPDDRRVHYEAVAQLRSLAASFLRERIEPRLAEGGARLNRLETLIETMPPDRRKHAARRITMLSSWSRNGRRVLPLVLRVLG